MSRSGYIDDPESNWALIQWRGAVNSAMFGARGQAFFKEMLAALDAMPIKRLTAHELVEETDDLTCSHWGLFKAESVCAIGAVGKRRGLDMSGLDPENYSAVAGTFNIADALAREIVYVNDEWGPHKETPEARYVRMRAWVKSNIRRAKPSADPLVIDEDLRWADDGGAHV